MTDSNQRPWAWGALLLITTLSKPAFSSAENLLSQLPLPLNFSLGLTTMDDFKFWGHCGEVACSIGDDAIVGHFSDTHRCVKLTFQHRLPKAWRDLRLELGMNREQVIQLLEPITAIEHKKTHVTKGKPDRYGGGTKSVGTIRFDYIGHTYEFHFLAAKPGPDEPVLLTHVVVYLSY